jgi:alkaline phosphatase
MRSNCKSSHGNEVDSILKWAHNAGKLVGIVSTTRITHATPAAAYANVPDRKWEAYEGVGGFSLREKNDGCSDIASQLIYNNSYINIIFGGGRRKFLHSNGYKNTVKNWEVPGDRVDDKTNLINDWVEIMKLKNKTFKFVSNASELRELKMKDYDHVLGKI